MMPPFFSAQSRNPSGAFLAPANVGRPDRCDVLPRDSLKIRVAQVCVRELGVVEPCSSKIGANHFGVGMIFTEVEDHADKDRETAQVLESLKEAPAAEAVGLPLEDALEHA